MSQGPIGAGWYHAEGDPPGTTRYWDGGQWVGGPQVADPGAMAAPFGQEAGIGHPPAADQLVSAGSRIGGRLLDGLIWFVIGLIVNLPVIVPNVNEALEAAQDDRDPVAPDIGTATVLITSLLAPLLIVAYEVFMNARTRGTFGKRAISARIVKEDGSPLDTRAALMRMVPFIGVQILGSAIGLSIGDDAGILSSLPFVIVGIAGLVMLSTDSRRQTPWDKTARTIVVRQQ